MPSNPSIAAQRLEAASLRAQARPVYEASPLETYYGGVNQQYTALAAKAQASIDKQTAAIDSVYAKNPFVIQAAAKRALDKQWAAEDKVIASGQMNAFTRKYNTPEMVAKRRAKELADATMAGLSGSVQRLYNADGTRRSTDMIGKSTYYVKNGMSWSDPNNPDPYNQVSGLSRTMVESTWAADKQSYGQQATDAADSLAKETAVSRAYQDIRFNQMKAEKMSAFAGTLNTYKGPSAVEEPLTNKKRSILNGGTS
jgi:hypothetical protein